MVRNILNAETSPSDVSLSEDEDMHSLIEHLKQYRETMSRHRQDWADTSEEDGEFQPQVGSAEDQEGERVLNVGFEDGDVLDLKGKMGGS